jgi:hypothetical protein
LITLFVDWGLVDSSKEGMQASAMPNPLTLIRGSAQLETLCAAKEHLPDVEEGALFPEVQTPDRIKYQ